MVACACCRRLLISQLYVRAAFNGEYGGHTNVDFHRGYLLTEELKIFLTYFQTRLLRGDFLCQE